MNFLFMCQSLCLVSCWPHTLPALSFPGSGLVILPVWLLRIFPVQQNSGASLLCPALPPAVFLLIQLPAFLLSDMISAPQGAGLFHVVHGSEGSPVWGLSPWRAQHVESKGTVSEFRLSGHLGRPHDIL